MITGVREGSAELGNMMLLNMANRDLCSSLELAQTMSLNMLPTHRIALVLSNDRMYKRKNSSFSGLDPLKRFLWSVILLEAMFVFSVH